MTEGTTMESALHLQVRSDGLATLTFDLPDKKVNVFTLQVLEDFRTAIGELWSRQDIKALILLSGKPGTFIAGFDIEEIAGVTDPEEAEEGSRIGHRLFDSWSRLPFATISAVQGTCLGGGTELSLACDYIVISDRSDIRIGLPEVRLGIVPAWGGCSRLPHRVGITAALDIILAGKAVNPRKAFKIGLADALLPDAAFLHHVRNFAAGIAQGKRPAKRRKNLKTRLLETHPLGRNIVFNQARKQVMNKTGGHYPAPLRAIEVIEIAVAQGLEAGLDAEARATRELAVSPVSKNLMHVFRLMEGAQNQALPADPRALRATAVLGAGVMGGGIAQLIADRADLPVRLKDLAPGPLASGLAHAAALFKQQVERRRVSKPAAKEKMNLILPTLEYSGFGRIDLVVEAIVEELDIKKRVFADVASHLPEDAVLASNTSSLSIDLIAEDTPHPERVVGMHFFNPVDRMPLVEVIRGDATSDEAVSTIVEFSRQLGKTPVIVGDGPGFLVNRLLGFYMTESLWLLEEGHSIEEIDGAMTDWGMPLGPLALIDEVGTDVAVKVAHILAAALGDRLPLPEWADRIAGSGRLGAKSGQGIYLYKDSKRQGPDPGTYDLLGLEPPSSAPVTPDLVDRLVLPMVDEAARCLAERLASSAGDVDLAMIMGTGFPPFRGGLCRWADRQGLAELVTILEGMATDVGERFHPSAALVRAREAGGLYALFG
jgi:3-hydroxyacyl-CoA dehydrogenase/enoyl-CoA hydratase/3-hydroxybutyryl-CoA epimerase